MDIKIVRLLKPFLMICSVATISLVGAYSYASDSSCNQQNAYKAAQTYAFPTSKGDGNYHLLFSKSNVKKANSAQSESLSLKINKLITSSLQMKQLNSLSMVSDMKFVLVPSHQEAYFQIKKTSKGNKLFEMATQFNDQLQLILNKFKQLFIAKNNFQNNKTNTIKSKNYHLTS